ncbi:Poly [ADP-ribose] polymerase 1 [Trichoplax sp. H2]|nr:Poly [ADP-ribose] polymerase 1 [Trichoplax sp. H2]|eukprot:RDD42983.1 Poly [ADP-ribose] polymerase 1 [Trichoplax sp. H2]
MTDSNDLPFRAEYAKSNRAACKLCRSNIGKDTLRLAVMVQVPNWYHFSCFFKKNSACSEGDIGGFGSLRWDDQEKLRKNIVSGNSSTQGNVIHFTGLKTEYAKSSRGSCKCCGEIIEKDDVRIGHDRPPDPDSRVAMLNFITYWYHPGCFQDIRSDLDIPDTVGVESLKDFKKLKKPDQKELTDLLGATKVEKPKGKKRGNASKNDQPAKKQKTEEEIDEESKLKEQSKLLWGIHDKLKKTCTLDMLRTMLCNNNQNIPSGESRLLECCTDGMAFGALQQCEECKDGQLVYSSSSNGYRCTGNVTSWTKCMFETQAPKRKPWKISKSLRNDSDFLKDFKFKAGERIFPKLTQKAPTTPTTAITTPSAVAPKKEKRKEKCLKGVAIVIIGKLSKTQAALKKDIESLGGTVEKDLSSDIVLCISSNGEVKKNGKKIKEARELKLPIVDEDFLTAVTDGDPKALVSKHNIVDWTDGTDVQIASSKSKSSVIKMKVKGKAAVDPQSGKAETCHVLEGPNNAVYSVTLGLVDIIRGTNSFYKIQALGSDVGNKYFIFRSWGRVGTKIGGKKVEQLHKHEVVSEFEAVYYEKTGNTFRNRNSFEKVPGKFYPIDIDYGQDDEALQASAVAAGSCSQLPSAIIDLIKLIFDVQAMKAALIEFEIDLKKMPLGNLSKKQIEDAYQVLGNLQDLISNQSSRTKIVDATNKFYTLIPHDFGLKAPAILDDPKLIQAKTSMLDDLLDIAVAYNLIKTAKDSGKDPVDTHYESLKTDLDLLDHGSDEFEMVQKYTKNTHASTHSSYTLEVKEVFKVNRHGEEGRYEDYKDFHNRMLLWHGSRVTNFVGILSQGLRIAPPEAPVSANYCNTNSGSPTGLLLLCEVALGNMHELKQSKYITKLPKDTHSTKGLGGTAPNPSQAITLENGTVVPLGKSSKSKIYRLRCLTNKNEVPCEDEIQLQVLILQLQK